MTAIDMKNCQNQEFVDKDNEAGFCENLPEGHGHRVFMKKIPYSSFKNYFCYVKKSDKTDFPEFKYGKFIMKSFRVPSEEAKGKFAKQLSAITNDNPNRKEEIENTVGAENMVDKDIPVGFQLFSDFSLCFDKVNCKGPFHPYDRATKPTAKCSSYNAGPDTAEYSFSVSNEENPDMTRNMHHYKGICRAGNAHFNFQKTSVKKPHAALAEKSKTFLLQTITYTTTDEDNNTKLVSIDVINVVLFNDATGEVGIRSVADYLRPEPNLRKHYYEELESTVGKSSSVPVPGIPGAFRDVYSITAHPSFSEETKYEYINAEILPSKGNSKRVKMDILNSTDKSIKKKQTSPEQMKEMEKPEYWQTNKFFLGIEQNGKVGPLLYQGKPYNWFTFTETVRKGNAPSATSSALFWRALVSNRKEYKNMPIGKLHDGEDNSAAFVATVNICVSSVGSMGITSAKCHFVSKTVLVLPLVPQLTGANEKPDVVGFEINLADANVMSDDDEDNKSEKDEKDEDDVYPE